MGLLDVPVSITLFIDNEKDEIVFYFVSVFQFLMPTDILEEYGRYSCQFHC